MPQAMYVHPTGEPATPRGLAYNKRVTLRAIYKQAKKLLYKDIGPGWELIDYEESQVTVTVERIVYRMKNGGMLVIDRQANALGR